MSRYCVEENQSNKWMQDEDCKAIPGIFNEYAPAQRSIDISRAGSIEQIGKAIQKAEPPRAFQSHISNKAIVGMVEQKYYKTHEQAQLYSPFCQVDLRNPGYPHSKKKRR